MFNDRRIDKVVVCVHGGILFSHNKGRKLPFATTWVDLEGIMLGKINQTEKDKYCMISLTCGIYNKTKQNHIEKEVTFTFIRRKLNEGGQKVQTSSYKIGKY